MKKILSFLLVGVVVLGLSTGLAAAEKKIVVKDGWWYKKGRIPESIEKAVNNADVWGLMRALALAYFSYENPNIKVEPMDWSVWAGDAGEKLRAALASGDAPYFYPLGYSTLGGAQGMITEGLVADITDYVKDWEQTKYIPWVVWRGAWRSGRCYGLPFMCSSYDMAVVRRDWCKEAGIFNSLGEPAPEYDWTWDDLVQLATKLTDPKKKRKGVTLAAIPGDGFYYAANSFGVPFVIPDVSGKYTWRAGFNLEPGVEFLQVYKDLVWKYQAALVGPTKSWVDTWRDVMQDRAAIMVSCPLNRYSASGYRYTAGPGSPLEKDIIDLVPTPKGPQGVRTCQVRPNFSGINPSLSEEETEATFKLMSYCVGGWRMNLQWFMLGTTKLEPHMVKYGVEVCQSPYAYKGGGYVIDRKTHRPAGYVLDPDSAMAPHYVVPVNITRSDPVEPCLSEYGMWLPNKIAFDTALQAAISKIFTDPNADPKTELDKAANVANKTALNEKLEGVTKENMKNYYTALDAFYKENFPKYYEEVFKELFEKYYKVW